MKTKKIGMKIILASLSCVLVSAVVALVVMNIGSSRMIDKIMQDDTKTSMDALNSKVKKLETNSLKFAKEFSATESVKTAIESKDKLSIINAICYAKSDLLSDTEFVTVTDAKGIVLARTQSDKCGDSIANQESIRQALKGTPKSQVETATNIKFAAVSAFPVENDSGQVIGVISTGYKLDSTDFVDDLKASTGMQYSVFLNDKQISTTITKGNQRMMNDTLNTKISNVVLKQKKTYSNEADITGERYYTQYEPILDSGGNAVGAFFTGKPINSVLALRQKVTLITAALVLLIAIFCIFIFYRFSKKSISDPVVKMSAFAEKLANGNLNAEVVSVRSNDEIGQLVKSLQAMKDNLRTYVNDISLQLAAMSGGDMTSEISIDYIGDFAPIKEALLKISSSLNNTLSQINQSAGQVNSGAGQVSSGAQELAQGATEQASSIEQLSASITDVSEKADKNRENVRGMAQTMEKAVADVSVSNKKVTELRLAMDEISESSNQIKKIIKTIDGIAFQTNILALNAAVEAARAGEAGKGFAVVADEVRNLAGKSAKAAKETAVLIQTSLEKVNGGFKLADETAATSAKVYEELKNVGETISAIDRDSAAQAAAISQITQGVEQVSAVVQTNSATAEQSAAASEELSGQAAMLSEAVGKFKLKDIGAAESSELSVAGDNSEMTKACGII